MKLHSPLRWLLLPAAILVSAALVRDSPPAATEPVTPALSAQQEFRIEPLEPAFKVAAGAQRQGDFDAAEQALSTLTAEPSSVGTARFVLGLYAHANDEMQLAREYLDSGADRGSAFEDWRLFVLADAALADEQWEVADRALAELLLSLIHI